MTSSMMDPGSPVGRMKIRSVPVRCFWRRSPPAVWIGITFCKRCIPSIKGWRKQDLYEQIVLWFDACLFDQSMLAHILTCLSLKGILKAELLCVDAFPGIQPFHGLGQLQPQQLASLYPNRRSVTDAQFRFAAVADEAFATQDLALLTELSEMTGPPLPWVPAAATRWLQEQPDPATGLGRLESLALAAIRAGCQTPGKIFAAVAGEDTPPQFWGDTTLWAKINDLADRVPPLVQIEGPAPRLPQWESQVPLKAFSINASPDQPLDAAVEKS